MALQVPTSTYEEGTDSLRKDNAGVMASNNNSSSSSRNNNNNNNNQGVAILCYVALSGVVGAKTLELVCRSVCNVCRECCTWSVRVIKTHESRYNVFGRYIQPAKNGLIPKESRLSYRTFDNEKNTTGSGKSGPSAEDIAIATADRVTAAYDNAIAAFDNAAIGAADGTMGGDVVDDKGRTSSRIVKHRNIQRLAYLSEEPLSSNMNWPSRLQAMSFGWMFDHSIRSSHLPSSLLELDLGGGFNNQIDSITWPNELVKLTFGERFNRPVELTTWPTKLQVLIFGDQFNQPVERITWPLCLRKVIFGNAFDHPIRRAAWSATTIRILMFGDAFNQPVADVMWPSTLQELYFGDVFNQAFDPRTLPRGLQKLRHSDLCEQEESWTRPRLPNGCVLEIYRAELFDAPLLSEY